MSLIIPDKRIIFVQTELRWKCGDMLGVKFIDLDEDDKETLEQIIKENSEDTDTY